MSLPEKTIERYGSSDLTDSMYGAYAIIENIMEMKQSGEGVFKRYNKFLPTGDLEMFDYGRGFLCVSIVLVTYKCDEGTAMVKTGFLTADDGDFGGFTKPLPIEKAMELQKQIADYFDGMDRLPSQDSLNKDLVPMGMFVSHDEPIFSSDLK